MYATKIINVDAQTQAQEHLDNLTKPKGSLGALEDVCIRLAGIFGEVPLSLKQKKIMLFAGDHGIAARGVSAYPQEVTGQMLLNFAAGGAAINVLARHAEAEVLVYDMGTKAPAGICKDINEIKLAPGTQDMTEGPAMSREMAISAITAGYNQASALIDNGAMIIGLGDMGIGNTSAATAISSAIIGCDPVNIIGPGTGIDRTTMELKSSLIAKALDINKPDPQDGVDVLAKVGGLEFAGQTGAILAAADKGIPVVIDGFIACASALAARQIIASSVDFMLASHLSVEPGHRVATETLGLKPMLFMDMRLGEGTGAALAMTLIDAAIKIFHQMATFDSAGVAHI